MHRTIRAAAAAAIIATTGTACTHLETRPTAEVASVEPGESATQGAQKGLSYALPMVQYDLKITRALEACPTPEQPWPKFTAKVEAIQRYVAGERFEVDYEALSSIMKSTTFNVTYHDTGTLKSINSTAKDKTGDVLADVARIGLAVASVAMPGVSVAAGSGGLFASVKSVRTDEPVEKASGILECTPEAATALAGIPGKIQKVKDLTREIDSLTQKIDHGSALLALKLLTPDDQTALTTAARRLLTAEEELRTAGLELSAAQAKLSATEEKSWPNTAGDASSHYGPLVPDGASIQKLAALFVPMAGKVPCGSVTVVRPALDCIAAVSTLKAALVPLAVQAGGAQPASGLGPEYDAILQKLQTRSSPKLVPAVIKPTDKRWAKGIYVREPAEARLVVCLPGGEPGPGGCSVPQATVLNDKPVVAPQLGRLRLLPFTNGPFEDNNIELLIRANGLIESFKYGEESSAQNASSSLATIAEKVDTKLEAMETERRDDIKYARDTQAWMRSEAAAIREEELAKLTYQVSEKNKQLELLKSQAALAGASTSIQMEAEQAKLEAEVKEIQSQVAKIKLAVELAALTAPKT